VIFRVSSCSSRYAILGAGFAGISVAWHLLKESPKELRLSVDVYDEVGIGGGASGVSGGLLHPYSPKDSYFM
jgi:glycine/D-amino acid oxidase-like deaminating enzyme